MSAKKSYTMHNYDITARFQEAVKYVIAGTLIKEEHFSLFEAVGALEIGDAKMDSGCLEPGESLEDDFDMNREFAPEELIWLMDQLLNREVAWLMGYPLSQTLFTSLHVDRLLWPNPKKVEEVDFVRNRNPQSTPLSHQVLRAYCALLIKACDLVLAMVTSQHYYEEEDFTTQLFNRELLHRFPASSISEMGLQAVDALEASGLDHEIKQPLRVRLDFRMDVLDMLIQHVDGKSPHTSFFFSLHSCLDQQRESNKTGRLVTGAFSTKLQRRLASTVPPRPMVTVSMDEAWSFWTRMLTDCKDIFAVRLAGHSQDLLTVYQLFAYRAPQPSTYPRALLQSFLTLNEGLIIGRIDSIQFLQEDLRSLTLPASQLLTLFTPATTRLYDGNEMLAQSMQTLVEKFEQTFVNLYRALCLNGCRIRRTFCHALLEWDSKQSEVEELDTTIQSELQQSPSVYPPTRQLTFAYPLSSWVYHHKLNVLRLTIQMGFEQTIYAPHEVAGMYWYLSRICGMHLQHLERISHFVTVKDTTLKSHHTVSATTTTTTNDAIKECRFALDRLFHQYSWIKATELLASTLHFVFLVLQRIHIFTERGPLYSSDNLRHEIRMRPFIGLSIPEPTSPLEHQRGIRMEHLSTDNILDEASKISSAAKKAWEEIAKTSWHMCPLSKDDIDKTTEGGSKVLEEAWNKEVKDCLKVSISASLCVVTLRKMIGNRDWRDQAAKEVTLVNTNDPGRWHRWWVTPILPGGK